MTGITAGLTRTRFRTGCQTLTVLSWLSVRSRALNALTTNGSAAPIASTNSGQAFFYGGTSSLGGSVFSDLNNDGIRQTAEFGLDGITVSLTGTDSLGDPVHVTQKTDANGESLYSIELLCIGPRATRSCP